MEPSYKIRLYRSLFRGRDDVFAKRSPRTGAYFPEHTLNWDEFNAHKANGGRMATFKNKKLTPLSDEVILKHLTGQITIGIYPILEDNTSYFLAADFDKENWLEDSRSYQEEMAKFGLSGREILRQQAATASHVDLRSYAHYVLREGTLREKADFIRGLKLPLVLKDRKVVIA